MARKISDFETIPLKIPCKYLQGFCIYRNASIKRPGRLLNYLNFLGGV